MILPTPRILIVEDERIIALDLQSRLAEENYSIVGIVGSSEEAVEQALKHQVDLILMDINIEGKMDGIAAAKFIKEKMNVAVIFLSSFADEKTFHKAFETEPAAFLTKPFNERELLFTVRNVLNQNAISKALVDSEHKFKSLFRQIKYPMLLLDNKGTVKEINKAASILVQNNALLTNGLSWFDFFPEEEQEMMRSRWVRFLRTGSLKGKSLLEDKYEKSKYFEFELQKEVMPNQHLCIWRDISNLVEARKGLELLAQLQQEAPNPVIRINKDGHILYANSASRELLDFWKNTQAGKLPKEIVEKAQSLSEREEKLSLTYSFHNSHYSLLLVNFPLQGAINIYFTEVTDLVNSQQLTLFQKDMLELIAKGLGIQFFAEQLLLRMSSLIGKDKLLISMTCNAPFSETSTIVYQNEEEKLFIPQFYEHYLSEENKRILNELLLKKQYWLFPQPKGEVLPFFEVLDSLTQHNSLALQPIFNEFKVLNGAIFMVSVNGGVHTFSSHELSLLSLGAQLLAMGIAKDNSMLTLRKQAMVFGNLNDAIVLLNERQQITEWNPSAEKIFGISNAQALGNKLDSLRLFEKQNRLSKLMNYAATMDLDKSYGKLTDEFDFFHADGRRGIAEVSVIKVEGLNRLSDGTLLVMRDVTVRRKMENALSSSEANLQALIENTDDIIFSVDVGFNLITSNSGFTNFYHKYAGAKPLQGAYLFEHSLGELTEPLYSLLSKSLKGESALGEIEVTKDELFQVYDVACNPIFSSEGLLNGVSIFIRDITFRKAFEQELKRTNFELDSFVYRASHDLRAPLRSILGLVNIIKVESSVDQLQIYAGLIEKSVIKLDRFISDLTNFSRNTRMEVEYKELNLKAMIAETLENLRFMDNASRLEIIEDFQLSAPIISDPNRIQVILQNMLSNAIKYQNTLNAHSYLKISVLATPQHLTFTFEDNGKGIKQEYLHRIFDMFFRASEESFGSGIGLYITKQIMEKLGGTIQVSSELGVGTRFQLDLKNGSLLELSNYVNASALVGSQA